MRNKGRSRVLPLVGLLGVLGVTSCSGRSSAPTEPTGGAIFFLTVAQTAVPGQMGSEDREVIRDAATWTRIWAELRTGSSLPETPPAVDFQVDMVIVAAMATQPCVSQVTIRSITGDAGKTGNIRADVLEEPPGANCHCITSQRAFHIVRLPRTDGSVQFSIAVAPRAC